MEKMKEKFNSIRIPLMLFELLFGFVSFYVLSSSANLLKNTGMLEDSTLISKSLQMIVIIIALVLEMVVLWFGTAFIRRNPLYLFIVQMLVVILATGLLTSEMPILIIGTIPVIGIEIINLYAEPKIPMILLSIVSILLWIAYGFYNGILQAVIVLQSVVFISFIVGFYWRYYNKQLAERQKAEDLVDELQLAYSQVEESTLRTERQRVARELHDTLTQGLAGTVMQLEATQSFLENGDQQRALEIIKDTTNIARETLRDSRLTLTDLRATNEKSLNARLELLTDAFRKNYRLQANFKLKEVPEFSDAQLTEISRIVSEAMMNVVKHTDTRQVIVTGDTVDDMFKLRVIDYGGGINVKSKKGHYGMQGMHERAAKLDGALTVVNTPGEGTTVTLIMPTEKKDEL